MKALGELGIDPEGLLIAGDGGGEILVALGLGKQLLQLRDLAGSALGVALLGPLDGAKRLGRAAEVFAAIRARGR